MKLVPLDKTLSVRQRDYLLLTIFVLAQHGYFERALALVEGLAALGEDGERIRLARAVLQFLSEDYAGALAALEQMVPAGRGASRSPPSEESRMVRYITARCYCETGRRAEGEAMARSTE